VAIEFNRDIGDFDYGKVDRVSPMIRRVIAENPGRFTYTGTGTYLVGNGGGVAVIDPGPTLPVHIDAIVDALEPGEHISHILITHTHSDHSPGAVPIKERSGAQTWGQGPHGELGPDEPEDRISFDEFLTEQEKAEIAAEREKTPEELLREGPDTDFVPENVVGHGDIIEGDGWSFECVHTPGHTSNHLCFQLREEKALFSGDHVMGWSTSVIGPPDGSMRMYLDSLRLLLDRDDELYWPTHGPAIANPQTYVSNFIDHRMAREDQITQALANGPSTIKEMVPGMYADVDKRLWRAAAASVFAHMMNMIETDRVTSDGTPRITSVFALA